METRIPEYCVRQLAEDLVDCFSKMPCSLEELEEYLCYDTLVVALSNKAKVKEFVRLLKKGLDGLDSLDFQEALTLIHSVINSL
jgi:hypothetical protein